MNPGTNEIYEVNKYNFYKICVILQIFALSQ